MAKKKRSKAREEEMEDEVEQEPSASSATDKAGTAKSLYDILGVEKTASQQEIKKAYYKLALRLHPDKNPGDEDAKEKFQLLQKVISILGDTEKRAVYDQTGCTDDDAFTGDAAESLHEYFRSMYKKVTEDDIIEFEATYRGSDSEKKDLKDLYQKFKGNMQKVFNYMICSDEKLDSHRFKDIIDEALAAGELKDSKKYKQWAAEVSQRRPPTDPLKKHGKSKKDADDLFAIISQRREGRKERFDSMCSSFIAKYSNGKADLDPEPTEEEFEAARRKMEMGKQHQKRKRK
ncbi:Chaperone protein dnaJ 6 [Nymphaea thermarum]|nr:Chaperone protein dnaJ 6 [Nymphaea thermarum]